MERTILTEYSYKSGSGYRFIVDCSDKRNEYLSESLKADGHEVFYYSESESYCESAIFLFAPSVLFVRKISEKIPEKSTVFCSKIEPDAAEILAKREVAAHLYFDDELLAMKNAYLTAEGALGIIIENTNRSIKDSKALILGGGRVGKSLAKLLHDNRCRVFVATADPSEYAFASIFSDGVYRFDEFSESLSEFDLIVNTVPARILNIEILQKTRKDCLILDLASNPGGVDFFAATELGIKTIHALGIPGKTAPFSAAKIIGESVYRRLGIGQIKRSIHT